MADPFQDRMAELDALVDTCRAEEPFASSEVRDASNRSTRDWPWWGVQLERNWTDGADHQRVIATVTLHSDRAGAPSDFKGSWQARIWRDVSTDDRREDGGWSLPWTHPTATQLAKALAALLAAAESAMDADRSS